MQHFRDLHVWRRSHALVKEVYRLTRTFPEDERYGLVSQLRRAAASVATNIAEGAKRLRPTEFARYLNIAEASLAETHYLLLLSADLSLIPPATFPRLSQEMDEISRMLCVLRTRVHPS